MFVSAKRYCIPSESCLFVEGFNVDILVGISIPWNSNCSGTEIPES